MSVCVNDVEAYKLSQLRERAGAAVCLPLSCELGGPRCIARFVEVLFLGEPVVCLSYKDLTSGAFPQERLLSRDSNNEAKGVVSWPSGLETEALHDFFVITFQNAYALLLHQMNEVCLPSSSSLKRKGEGLRSSYLVDPASSHMLVSKIKPCMSKYKHLYTVRLRTAH